MSDTDDKKTSKATDKATDKQTEKAVEEHRTEVIAGGMATPAQANVVRQGEVELVEDPVHGMVPISPLGEDGRRVPTQGDTEKAAEK